MMEKRLPPRKSPSMPPTVLRMSRKPSGVNTVTWDKIGVRELKILLLHLKSLIQKTVP